MKHAFFFHASSRTSRPAGIILVKPLTLGVHMISLQPGTDRNTKAHIVTLNDVYDFFISYQTVVGIRFPSGRYRLPNTWGPTTGRHINEMGIRDYEEVGDEVFDKKMNEIAFFEKIECPRCAQLIQKPTAYCTGKPCHAVHVSYCWKCETRWQEEAGLGLTEIDDFQRTMRAYTWPCAKGS